MARKLLRYRSGSLHRWVCSLILLQSATQGLDLQGPSSQGLYGSLTDVPTFREEDYLGAKAERARFTEASDFTYDFANGEGLETLGKGGSSLQVELQNKPSLLRSDSLSQTVFTLEKCGLNVPHAHPRATKVMHVLEGILSVGFVEEGMSSTARVISQNITVGQSFVFPRGLVMWVHNLNCERARYLDTWSSPDPGILNLAPALLKMPLPTVAAALNIDTASAAALIARSRSPIEQGPAECLARCNVTSQENPAGPPSGPADIPADISAPSPVSIARIATLTAPSTNISVLTAGG